MKIIGIETSSIQGGIAILENDIAQDELLLKRGLIHGKLLVPALDRLLKKAGWRKESIDLITVDIGPGSYTGLRVGLAIAKTISYVLNVKLVGVPSLDILSANVSPEHNCEYICPVIDAKWNQVYTAIYKNSINEDKPRGAKAPRPFRSLTRITDYLAISPQDLVRLLKGKNDLLLFGDGLKSYRGVFDPLRGKAQCSSPVRDKLGDGVILGPEQLWYPRARNVAILGYELYKQGKEDDPIKLLPFYLRPTEAEINLRGKTK